MFLYEGDTELEFYNLLFDKFLPQREISIHKVNLKGVYSLNKKVINKIETFLIKTHQGKINVIIAHDREGDRSVDSLLSEPYLEKYFKQEKRIISIVDLVATQDLESWFFHDIDGIYEFLRVPKNQRTKRAYNNIESKNHADLSSLFRRYEKYYRKGERVIGFVSSLDLEKIVSKTTELQDILKFIKGLCKSDKKS